MLISPTGSWEVRSDAAGGGEFGSRRGNRIHLGIDLLCVPEQSIIMPCEAESIRRKFPYSDFKWEGIEIFNPAFTVTLFYVSVFRSMPTFGKEIGGVIGTAQDITEKYPGQGMQPHIHMEVAVNPVWMSEMFTGLDELESAMKRIKEPLAEI